MIKQLSAPQLKQRLDNGEKNFIVLDVREPWEIAIASLPGSTNIPMREIPTRVEELPDDKDIVVLCHHGVRSMSVANFLERAGFENLYNLTGGIAAWSRDADPETPTY
jgi:rhodanese-related sulfurtransferase